MNEVIFYVAGIKLKIKQGDITDERVDAIINAANNHLIMGGGVAGAIKKRGGQAIQEEAKKKGPIPVGEAAVTGAGQLPARYVIHAATMGMDFQTDEEKIRLATRNSLKRADELKLETVAFPALGCGVGGFSTRQAAVIMAEEVLLHPAAAGYSLKEIVFVLFDQAGFSEFSAALEEYLGGLCRKTFRTPVPTVDIILEVPEGVVLIKRKNPPPGWAIPGGFVDYGESLEEAAVREAKEETGLEAIDLKQFHTYSAPGRDPRVHTISTVFTARGKGRPKAQDDAVEIGVFSRNNLPEPLAFDHREILEEYFRKGR